MTEPESGDDERDDLDDDEEEDESPPPPKAKQPAPKASGAASKRASAAPVKAAATPLATTQVIGIGIVLLVIGSAVGWFGHIQQAKAALHALDAAAPTGSAAATSGPCGAWQSKICTSAGNQSASCQQAKGAAELLLPSACQTALGSITETLAKVKAARASCDKLVTKICKDLPPESKICGMVKERTPSFPTERCEQMLQNYDKVIGELKQMDAQGGMGAPQMGGPGMRPGMPPGMPPGAVPHVSIPQAPPHP